MKRLITWAAALACAGSIFGGISYLATTPTAVRANLLMARTSTGGGSSFVGPGNVLTGWAVWGGNRAFTTAAANAHNQIMRIIRTSDSHICDVLAATSGAMGNTGNCTTGGDNGTLWTTWCAATTCEIDTSGNTFVYDQSGSGIANWVGFNFPVVIDQTGSSGCFIGANNHQELFTPASSAATQSQPYVVSIVAKITGDATSHDPMATVGINAISHNGTNHWEMYAGFAIGATANDNVFHAGNILFNGTSSNMNIDGTSNIVSAGVVAAGSGFYTFMSDGSANSIVGSVCEIGVHSGDQSASFGALSTNQHASGGPNAAGF
jgi:hypothetical protein